MNQFFQRLLGAFEATKSQTTAAVAADESLQVLTTQQAEAVAGGPVIATNT